MKELRMNLQGSWKRILAMITVAAMCFSVVSISPAFASDVDPVHGVTFSAVADGDDPAVAITQPEKAEVAIGGELQLAGTAAVAAADYPALTGYTVTWASEDEEKATVNADGKVTGVAAGEVDITLEVKKDGTTVDVAKTLKITVLPDPIHGVTFSAVADGDDPAVAITQPEKAEVAIGGELQLAGTAAVAAADLADLTGYTVTWASEDEEKATVNADGKVTGVAEGKANITLEVKKADATVGEKQTLEITVTPKENEDPDVSPAETVTTVEAVKVNKAATELTVGGTEKLTAEVTVSPADAAKPVPTWNSSNEKVAKVAADGTVTAIAEGTANITATAKIGDSEKTSAPCVVTVKAKPATSTTDKPAEGNKPQNTTSNAAPKVGEKKVVAGVTYQVAKNNTVTYQKPKKNAKKVTIPATVKINGKTYKVTSIAKNAFKGNKKVKTVKVGKNVTTIGASAFQNCKALTTVTLPAKTATIGKNAFANSKKLKKIVIKSTKMTKKTVKNGAFKSVSKKATIDVPNKKAKTYKKLFQKKGLPKACKVK